MASDEALMVELQAGDETALAILMDRYHSRLYAFVSRRAGSAAADDLFQESWIRVVRARQRFDPRRRFSTWLFQIANNLCRDRARRLAARGRALEESRQQAVWRAEAVQPEPVELRQDVQRRLDALPGRLREVVVLRYFHDLSERELAEVLEIPRGTVKSRLHAAMRALRAQQEPGASDAPA